VAGIVMQHLFGCREASIVFPLPLSLASYRGGYSSQDPLVPGLAFLLVAG
jgi:hypothetical protein